MDLYSGHMNWTRLRDFAVLVVLIGLISWLVLSGHTWWFALPVAVVAGWWARRMAKRRQAG